jgi:hypothetical protein
MDIQTTLNIIRMIDNQIKVLNDNENMDQAEYYGATKALNKLQDHLQSFIEAQLNAAENQSGE